MNDITSLQALEQQVRALPSLHNQALRDIVQGLYQGKPLLGKDGLLTNLLKDLTQIALQGEMDAHLEENTLEQGNNRRNGITRKKVKAALGSFELAVPRDRNASFEPQLVKKRQTLLNEELDNKVLALYSLGNSYEAITAHLQEIYGLQVAPATITAITDRLLPQITEWRSRPLEAIYPVVFLDAMFFKVREEGKVVSKALYNVMGINQGGYKEILGFYTAQSEGAHFWLTVLNDLKARGVKDILICCIDGLQGFREGLQSAFPLSEVQLCVVHQIRSSLKRVASKHQKAFIADLKSVYQASSKDVAEANLLGLEERWGKQYGLALKPWKENWEELSTYFKYSAEIRKLIYTTNPIEGFHRQVRKYTKTKGSFSTENGLLKLVYSAIRQIGSKWNQPLSNWALTMSQLEIFFPGRLDLKG